MICETPIGDFIGPTIYQQVSVNGDFEALIRRNTAADLSIEMSVDMALHPAIAGG